jgi:hypothetical protein
VAEHVSHFAVERVDALVLVAAVAPPALTTKVPWKLRRLAASWMRSSQARTSPASSAGDDWARAAGTNAAHAKATASKDSSERAGFIR